MSHHKRENVDRVRLHVLGSFRVNLHQILLKSLPYTQAIKSSWKTPPNEGLRLSSGMKSGYRRGRSK